MPPKGKKGKGKKAGKKAVPLGETPDNLEEEQRLAAEREAARIAFEQEQEARRKEKEAMEEMMKQEAERFDTETQVLQEMLNENKSQLKELREQVRSQKIWDRFLLCNGTPDPTVQSELNTFTSLSIDETKSSTSQDVSGCLGDVEQALDLINELEEVMTLDKQLDITEGHDKFKEGINSLQGLIETKVDNVTFNVMRTAEKFADPDSLNLLIEKESPRVKFSLWGNLAKNPRQKSFKLETDEFQMEIPKSLANADVAVRLIHTSFDFLSPKCKSFFAHKKKSPAPSRVPSAAGQQNGEGATEGAAPAPEETAIENVDNAPDKNENVTDNQEKRPSTPSDADEIEDEDIVDLRAMSTVGGVMYLDLLKLPPQAKKVGNWVIQDITENALERIPNPTPEDEKEETEEAKEGEESGGEAAITQLTKELTWPLLNMSFTVASNAVFTEEPQLARWEDSQQCWRTDGFEDVNFDDQEGTISFKSQFIGPICTFQDTYNNMPFQSWEIRPYGQGCVIFTLIAASVELEISIKENACCLNSPEDMELDGIRNKWFPAHILMQKLVAAGINVFPSEDADKYVSISVKDEELESSVYEQMALASSAFAFSWSRWNADCGEKRQIVRAAENLTTHPVDEDMWKNYSCEPRKSYALKCTDDDDEMFDEKIEGTQFHPDIFHCLKEDASSKALEILSNTSYTFVDNVSTWLFATKVLTFS